MSSKTSIADLIESLSSLVRTGWMLRGVPPALGETVAVHSFAAALIALEAGFYMKKNGLDVDPYKAASIALVHDLAEGAIGDIARVAGISKSEKSRAEREAFTRLGVSDEVTSLFYEFEEESSIEARVARFAEITATLLKSLRYESLGYRVGEIKNNMEAEARLLASSLGLSDFLEGLITK